MPRRPDLGYTSPMQIRVRDVELFYERAGAGPPLLLLHGLGSSTADWSLQLPAFAPHFEVLALDARGHGRSSKPPGPYSVPMLAADTAAFLEALAIPAAHVLGLSMGGMIGLQLALDRPDLVQSLVVVNSAPELTARTWREKLRVAQRLALVHLLSPRGVGRFLSRRLFPRPEQAPLRALMAARYAQNDRRAYLAAMRALINWSVMDRLSDLRCPTLVVAGDQDYTPPAYKETYAAQIPDARLVVIEDSRHATPIDQPERFNQVVLDFLLVEA
jgi:3-oxoadipate enol-lactonase